jgi:hypothetical protein
MSGSSNVSRHPVLVMLLASSIVTVASQWPLNLRNYRAVVLGEGLKLLLIGQLDHMPMKSCRRSCVTHSWLAGTGSDKSRMVASSSAKGWYV